jgi:hypothetical protein
MKKFHALVTGIVGVSLSATAVLAAAPRTPSEQTSTIPTSATVSEDAGAPHPDNHGATVSAVAKDQSLVGGEHGNHGGAVSEAAHQGTGPDAVEDPATEPEDPGTEPQDAAPHPDNHGAAVSAVAKDKSQVGGKHQNHGGAVSEAAHQGKAPKTHGSDKHGGGD